MLCKCGCGCPTTIANRNDHQKGWVKGEPIQYISYHHHNTRKRNSRNPYNYRSKIDKILGHPLPIFAVIHHVDGNPRNDDNNNLVVCENDNYHKLLHQRTRALKACGHSSWRRR